MDIFEVHYPLCFWFLPILIIPLFLIFCSWRQFFGFEKNWRQNPYAFEGRLPPWSLRIAKAVFCFTGLVLVITALADPFYRHPVSRPVYEGIRFIFVVDVSLSMKGAEDISPNRLIAAKEEIKTAVSGLEGSYKLAIIPFAGEVNTYYYLPSFDRTSFLWALKNLSDETVPIPGTNLAGALAAPLQLLRKVNSEKGDVNVVILISDGGKEEGFSADRSKLRELAAKLSAQADLYVIGVGKPKPAPLVKRDWDGNFQGYYRQPPAEQRAVYSQLDESLLKFIAAGAGGQYFRFDQQKQLQAEIKKTVEKYRRLARTEQVWKKRPLRSWLLLGAIVMFLLFLAELPAKKNALLR